MAILSMTFVALGAAVGYFFVVVVVLLQAVPNFKEVNVKRGDTGGSDATRRCSRGDWLHTGNDAASDCWRNVFLTCRGSSMRANLGRIQLQKRSDSPKCPGEDHTLVNGFHGSLEHVTRTQGGRNPGFFIPKLSSRFRRHANLVMA